MTTSASSEEMIANIQKNFVLGGHKAAAIGMVLKKAKVFLVSDLDEAFVKSIFLEPYNSVDKALDSAFEALGSDAKVIVMPYGGSTLPFVG